MAGESGIHDAKYSLFRYYHRLFAHVMGLWDHGRSLNALETNDNVYASMGACRTCDAGYRGTG